jgi:hypothetical protein
MGLAPTGTMVTILSNQEEKFCKVFAETRNAIIAFSKAYPEYRDPKIHRAEGSKLLKRADISSRIDDLINAAEEPYQYTFEEHLMELRRIRDLAVQKGLLKVALQAEQLRGELLGFHNELLFQKKKPSQHLHVHESEVNNERRGPTTDDVRATALLEILSRHVTSTG